MSILLYDPTEKRHVLLLREGPWAGKRWSVDLRVCDNPLCGCFHVDFLCKPEGGGSLNPDEAPVSFALDTQERSVYRPPGRRMPPMSAALAEDVAAELGESGWKYLYEFLLGVKQEQIENCDPKRLDADFPPEVLRGDKTVVSYSEIFPFAPGLFFRMGSKKWFALDDYCVNPDCDCHQVVLQFVPQEPGPDRSRAPHERPPAMYYDYRNREFEEAKASQANQPSLNALLDEVRRQRTGFDSEVRRRHKWLKALFKRALQKHAAGVGRSQDAAGSGNMPPRSEPTTPPRVKTGRNEQCPCGSGRKYKKCCGRGA